MGWGEGFEGYENLHKKPIINRLNLFTFFLCSLQIFHDASMHFLFETFFRPPLQIPLNSPSLSQLFLADGRNAKKKVLKIQQRAKIAQNRFDVAIGAVETRLMFDYFPLLFYHSHLKIIHSLPLLLFDSAAMRKKRFKIAYKKKFSSACHICREFEAAREFFFGFP